MVWYHTLINTLVILGIIFGIMLLVFSPHHSKRGVWGIILILILLIVKSALWIAGV